MTKIKEMADISDLVLICGDVGGKEYYFKDIMEFSSQQRKDAEYLDSLLSDIGATSRFILGNDDWFEYDGGNYMSKGEDIAGEHLVPFEYVGITPFNTNREVNENKLRYELGKLACAGVFHLRRGDRSRCFLKANGQASYDASVMEL